MVMRLNWLRQNQCTKLTSIIEFIELGHHFVQKMQMMHHHVRTSLTHQKFLPQIDIVLTK